MKLKSVIFIYSKPNCIVLKYSYINNVLYISADFLKAKDIYKNMTTLLKYLAHPVIKDLFFK